MPSNKISVLIVDDQIRWIKILKRIISEKLGFSYDTAVSYAEAINYINKKTYDLAILDIRLSDFDSENLEGIAILDFIENNSLDTKVIMLTGFGTMEIVRKAFKKKALLDFFDKSSFESSDLVAFIRKSFG